MLKESMPGLSDARSPAVQTRAGKRHPRCRGRGAESAPSTRTRTQLRRHGRTAPARRPPLCAAARLPSTAHGAHVCLPTTCQLLTSRLLSLPRRVFVFLKKKTLPVCLEVVTVKLCSPPFQMVCCSSSDFADTHWSRSPTAMGHAAKT